MFYLVNNYCEENGKGDDRPGGGVEGEFGRITGSNIWFFMLLSSKLISSI